MDAASPTLGMRLDTALGHLEALKTTQVYYALIVIAVTVVISFGVLGSPREMPEIQIREYPKRQSRSHPPNAREPRWHIFRWVNYAAVTVFCWSVADFALHWHEYLHSDNVLLQFLFGWSVLLCYFFGFFGVSFVHDTVVEPEETTRYVVHREKKKSPFPLT